MESINLVITKLVLCSTTEDKYGVVHADIPKVLEHLVSCHSSIEVYVAQQSAKKRQKQMYMRMQPGGGFAESQAALQVLETCIYTIIAKFYSHLERFKFSSLWSQKIQKFADFKQ